MVFEISFDGVENLAIEVSLPDISAVPEERTLLTKTGRVSHRRLTIRDRAAIYADLCAALALRLIYETFRVLLSVNEVEIFGTTEDTDPATGQPREFVALHLSTTREAFHRLNLDAVEPRAALEGLGGRLAYSRRGDLQPLEGVEGLREEV